METICTRCLEREPNARYHSAGDLAEDLERWLEGRPIIARPVSPAVRVWRWTRRNPKLAASVAGCVAGGVAVLTFGTFVFFPGASPLGVKPPISEKSIAVLPFEDLGEEKQNGLFAEGVQDEILNDLAKVADLKVISRTSTMQYRSGRVRNLREIAQTLGVAKIVEGSVQRVGDRVRVSAQLIDARSDTHLLAERYDRNIADVFATESELAELIVSKLRAKLLPNEKVAIEQRPTQDLSAYNLYLQAKDLLDTLAFDAKGKGNLVEAARLLQESTRRDPKFLRAYYELARVDDLIYFIGVDHTPDRLQMADAAVENARRLGPQSGEAHLALAQHLYWGSRDYNRARQELVLARQRLPNEPLTFLLAGYLDRREGRWEESVQELERALELDPQNIFILQVLANDYQYLRRFDKVASTLDRIAAIDPKDETVREERAAVDLLWHADPRPLHVTIQSIIAQDSNAVASLSAAWLFVALEERDSVAAKRALSALPVGGCSDDTIPFPNAWCEGLVARARSDSAAARAAFTTAQAEAEVIIRGQPDYAEELCVLGMIDAALGKRGQAIAEGRRAVELLPISKDWMTGAKLRRYLAIIYAWAGEKKLALDELTKLTQIPSDVSYGELRLDPYWDPLRTDPRFEKIVESLAPDAKKP